MVVASPLGVVGAGSAACAQRRADEQQLQARTAAAPGTEAAAAWYRALHHVHCWQTRPLQDEEARGGGLATTGRWAPQPLRARLDTELDTG